MPPDGGLQRRFYDMLLASQFWPTERMRDHQRSQLGQLLRHARASVPFYAHRLEAVFRPNGDIDWERWGEVPLLTRADLQTNREAMQARELPAGHGDLRVATSSGSTGTPIVTTHNRLEATAGDAAQMRALQWHAVDFDRLWLNLAGDDPARAAWPTGERRGPWGPPWQPGQGARHDLNILTAPEHTAEFLGRGGFGYISGLPSRIEAVAYAARDRSLPVALDAVFSLGEAATPYRRRLFRDVFGARTIELYAAAEAFRMAHSCPEHTHFHINAELGLLEILTDDGRPASPGEAGEVIATSFYNTAQPIIRYRTGDIAVAGRPCSCGRTLPVLERVVGRIFHQFVHPDGRRFVPAVLEQESNALAIRTWQLAQVGADTVEFRFVMQPGTAADPTAIMALLRKGLPEDFRIVLAPGALAPRPGKHALIVNEMQDGRAP